MLPARKIHFEAKKKEKENLRFRSFLKCNADEEELDQQFLQLHKELFENFDCGRCRNCCKEYCAELTTDEVKKVFSGERDFSEVFFAMVRDGVLVRFDEKHYMHWEMRQKALDMAYLLYEEKGMIQTGEFRDRLGISRKCAIILLERFDRERITVMENGGRVLKRNLQQADRSQ